MKAPRSLIAAILSLAACETRRPAVAPAFEDVTAASGLERYTPTFGAAFADIDDDGDEDLIVSNHGRGPTIYLQTETATYRETPLLASVRGDLHGITVADVDNDGDDDLVIACGGDDGIGAGCSATVLRNLLTENAHLAFDDVSESSGLSELPGHRSRMFLPTTSDDGSRIDLYLTGRKRPEFPNRYYINKSDAEIRFAREDDRALAQSYRSDGTDVFFDFDRDGDRDLLLIDLGSILLFEKTPEGFSRVESSFDSLVEVMAAAVGDVDRDGDLDVFVGTRVPHRRSDRVSHDATRIHFFVRPQDGDVRDALSFESKARRIRIDFNVKRGLLPNDASTIFVGEGKENPPRRRARIPAGRAAGAPEIDAPGTYLWHDAATRTWHVVWQYGGAPADDEERGSIRADGLAEVTLEDLEPGPEGTTDDVLFINDGFGGFTPHAGTRWTHPWGTVAARFADVNNDGWVDIVGLRAGAPGDYNGEPFVIVNEGGLRFREVAPSGLESPDDDLFMADQLVTGLVNDDGLLDLFATNGAGLNPGNRGPYKLFLNRTVTEHHYVVLELEGTRSNRNALGAQVELVDERGRILGYQELGAGFHRSQPSRKLHFGVGDDEGPLRARIRWPSGVESEHDVALDRTMAIREP